MADLEIKKQVAPTVEGEPLPKTYQRTQDVEVTQFPDLQTAYSQYAKDSNWMSAIGSQVAASASNAIANTIGNELGKKPQGDIGLPITDFDKQMQDSYKTQAQATLGIQANKLISDINLQIAKQPRLSPNLIADANKNISIGLQNIFKNAPTEVRPELENHYSNIQVNQFNQMNERMIREQREDRKNNTAYASQLNAENAYSLAMNGNYKAAEQAVNATIKANQADVASRITTPETAKVNIDTARQSYLSGKYINGYIQAYQAGTGEQYLKSLSDKKPSDLSDIDYLSVTNNVLQYANHQQSLRTQDETLRATQMNVSIVKDVMGITGAQMNEYKNNVSPEQYAKTQISYFQAIKAYKKEHAETSLTIAQWQDPSAFARMPDKAINNGFDLMTARYVEQSKSQGIPMTEEEAEVQVASIAGGKIPVFTDSLTNKLYSNNPVQMDSAVRQIDSLYSMNANSAIRSIPDDAKAIYMQYKSLHDSMPPMEAAKIAIQNANQPPDVQQMNKEKWSGFIRTQTANGIVSPTDFALNSVGVKQSNFANVGTANVYGQMILDKYKAFYQMLNGDQANALELTKRHVAENYGYTGVNGDKEYTLHPIEKMLGYYENSDVVPFIQHDLMNKISPTFDKTKELFNTKETEVPLKPRYLMNEYWEFVPREKENVGLIMNQFVPVQVKRYVRTEQGVKSQTYNLGLRGNSYNYDIVIQGENGVVPLMQYAPYMHIQTYTPDKGAIDDAYQKAHGVKK